MLRKRNGKQPALSSQLVDCSLTSRQSEANDAPDGCVSCRAASALNFEVILRKYVKFSNTLPRKTACVERKF